MGSKFPLVVIILLLAVVSFFVYRNTQLKQQLPEFWPRTNSTRPSPSPFIKTGLPSDWQTFTSFQNVYTFKYPNILNVEEFQEDVRLARKDNPDAPAGIFIDFRIEKLPQGQDLREFIEQQMSIAQSAGEITYPLVDILVNSYDSYSYGYKGLGEQKHYFIPRFDGQIYMHIIDSTVDSSTQDFKGTADNIVQTFSFTQ